MAKAKLVAVSKPSNDGRHSIDMSVPYAVHLTIQGTSDVKGNISLPCEYLRQAIIHAAKFEKDPRSPRKSAMDLFKAGVVSITDLASLGVKEPDYLDKRRVTIQRNSISRVRPAIRSGWKASLILQVLTPEYIDIVLFKKVLDTAGRLVGVGDFRPTFGRFSTVNFDVKQG